MSVSQHRLGSLFNHCQQFTNEGVHAWEKALIDIWSIARFSFQIALLYSFVRCKERLTLHVYINTHLQVLILHAPTGKNVTIMLPLSKLVEVHTPCFKLL